MADVSLDGALVSRFDLYSATEQPQAPIYTATGLSAGPHTLRIDVTGEKNAASSAALVVVDAFDVTLTAPAPVVTRLQETASAISYSADWALGGTSGLSSGENAEQTTTSGATATFTFTGTSVRWIGERGFSTGLARVSIDGVFVALVDTRTSLQEEYQEALFRATGLSAGSHPLTSEVVGRNNDPPGSPVERVVIDAFDIY